MSRSGDSTWLSTIATLDREAALDTLRAEGRLQGTLAVDTLLLLAEAALVRVETDSGEAASWLAIAHDLRGILDQDRSSNVPESPENVSGVSEQTWQGALAHLYYASARLAVHQGQLVEAEIQLQTAQQAWQQAGDEAGAARSLLGLTQILAMQGRYEEAETAATTAVTLLRSLDRPDDLSFQMQLVGAHHNLATLYVYTERHRQALNVYAQARTQLDQLTQQTLDEQTLGLLRVELAHNALNRASALTFLDDPDASERALQEAITYFDQTGDLPDRGRAQTNLGRLYLRTGRYAAALAAFDRATADLLGDSATDANIPVEKLRHADELLLEQAMAYLVMNLLPEAEQSLARSELLFRSAGQPYELGQALYTWGVLQLRATDWRSAQPLLAEAGERFTTLGNRFWLNRTRLAQAALAYRERNLRGALAMLNTLWTEYRELTATPEISNQEDAIVWDIAGLAELQLLRLRIQIALGEWEDAEQTAVASADMIAVDLATLRTLLAGARPLTAQTFTTEEMAQLAGPLPHYTLRLHHLLGRLARARGDSAQAHAHLQQALTILEGQRSTLPVEEIRTAFLDDKTEIYVDLIALLLELADEDPTLMATAFATVERARSRALLERLLSATSDEGSGRSNNVGNGDGETSNVGEEGEAVTERSAEQLEALRQRLHWLYNQLLGESGSRNLNPRLSEQLLREEAALQRLEWQRSRLLQQADPVDLATFQSTLAADQQAIVYTILGEGQWLDGGVMDAESYYPATAADIETSAQPQAGAEVMAFLIDRETITAYRHLTTTATLQRALDELRFQLGRAELGTDYLKRHQARLRLRLNEVLGELYHLLLAPLRPALTAARLLMVPAGPLHRLPFHALWDGQDYLAARYECSYAPSASIVVMRQQRSDKSQQTVSWAGLAVKDAAIPAARAEVTGVARYFDDAHLYLDEAANRAGLERAAQSRILHLATHGLFRPDNPFFSALKLDDGWIDVREIYRLRLQSHLVVLSACESGAGQIRGGDEVVGLARGFLGAGAQEILASLWNVHDESAVDLMDRFYHHYIKYPAHEQEAVDRLSISENETEGNTVIATTNYPTTTTRPAAALRAAQLEAIESEQHPYFWAPFFVIGD